MVFVEAAGAHVGIEFAAGLHECFDIGALPCAQMLGADQEQRIVLLHKSRIELAVRDHIDPVAGVAQMAVDRKTVVGRIIPAADAGVVRKQDVALRHQHCDARHAGGRFGLRPERFGAVDHRRIARQVVEAAAAHAVRRREPEGRIVVLCAEVSEHEKVAAFVAVRRQPPVALRELPAGTGVIVRLAGEYAVTELALRRVVRQDAVVKIVHLVGVAVAVAVLVDAVPPLAEITGAVGENFVVQRTVADDRLHLDRALRRFGDDGAMVRVAFLNRLEVVADEIGVSLLLKPAPVEPRAGLQGAFGDLRRLRVGKRLVRFAPGAVQFRKVAAIRFFEKCAERRYGLLRIVERRLPFVVDPPDEDAAAVSLLHDGVDRRGGGVEHVLAGGRVEVADHLAAVFPAGVADRALDRPVVLRLR